MKSALVLIADGVEELEAVTVIDLLRRAGVRVTVAAVSASKTILAQAKVSIVADELLNQIPDKLIYDALVLPGGMGAAQTFSKVPKGKNIPWSLRYRTSMFRNC